MNVIKQAPEIIYKSNQFCAGCGHGIAYRLIQEAVEELGYKDNHITVLGVGCSCNLNTLTAGDKFQCAHGRAAAVATGMKHTKKDTLIFTYQGDGDAGVIGIAETLNAAYRNEKITVFTVNNSNFGMTGGQMSLTTLSDQITTTTPLGRDCELKGYPFHLPEMIASQFTHVAYVARGAVNDAKNIRQLKKMIKNGLEAQVKGEGYSLIEVLAPCPTNWNMTPLKSLEWLEENMLKEYPIGEFKKRGV